MNISNLLKYQELELAIIDIDKKINDTEEFKVYMQCNQIARQTKQQINDLEQEAEKLIADTDNGEILIKKIAEKINDIKVAANATSEIEELDVLEKNLRELNNTMQKTNSDLSQASQRAYIIMTEAQKNLDRFREASEKGREASVKLREIKAALAKETKPFREEYAKIKATLPKYALDLYENAKKHNKIRWVVQRENGYCIGCGQNVELETAKKIEELGIAECPRCFRVLYIE